MVSSAVSHFDPGDPVNDITVTLCLGVNALLYWLNHGCDCLRQRYLVNSNLKGDEYSIKK